MDKQVVTFVTDNYNGLRIITGLIVAISTVSAVLAFINTGVLCPVMVRSVIIAVISAILYIKVLPDIRDGVI